MKMIIDFTYYSVFTLIPDKATLGKSTGAATLHAAMFSFFYMAVWMWPRHFLIAIKIDPMIEILLIFGGHFLFNWVYFLNEAKQTDLQKQYGHIEKWKAKVVGISFMLFCFFSFVFTGITISLLNN